MDHSQETSGILTIIIKKSYKKIGKVYNDPPYKTYKVTKNSVEKHCNMEVGSGWMDGRTDGTVQLGEQITPIPIGV